MLVHFDGSDHFPDAQIVHWTLKSLPGCSNHSPDPQITSLAMLCYAMLCLLACLLVHFDGSDHSLDAQIIAWSYKSLPGLSNHAPKSMFKRLNHVTNCKITYFTLKIMQFAINYTE
jgi:hypothetical protein